MGRFKSIASCDDHIQQELYENVVLSGGNTMFGGMAERLQKELSKLAPPSVTVFTIHSLNRRAVD
jgi:actin-related protein